MAWYEYECREHGVIEVQQRVTDAQLSLCPLCLDLNTETPVKKLISLSSFHLSGSGWAKDNYSK